jgi:hypothetical protein
MTRITKTLSFEDMVTLLSFAKGVNLETFNEDGMKSLEQLHRQLVLCDVKLIFLWGNSLWKLYYEVVGDSEKVDILGHDLPPELRGMEGHLLMERKSAKVLIEAEGYKLLETQRVYKRPRGDVTYVVGVQRDSGSESIREGETALDAIVRGLEEEFGLKVDPRALEILSNRDEIRPIHKSTVFPGILVRETVQGRFRLPLPERPWREGKIYPDDGAEIHTEWFKN